MRFSVLIPNLGQLTTPCKLTALARRSEALGCAGVFLNDHLALPG